MILLHCQTMILLRDQENKFMARGGRREGAGGKPSWNYGRTKPVRVPIALADKILEIARVLDEQDSEIELQAETGSKVIDLTGVAIIASKQGPVVLLSDLLRVGYEIRPERLVRNLKPVSSSNLQIERLLENRHE